METAQSYTHYDIDRVEANLRAADVHWSDDPDLPDPFRYRDVIARPDLVAGVLQHRSLVGSLVGQPRVLPFPKARSNDFRAMTVLDPIAQLAFRLAVERVALLSDSVLSSEVLHSRVGRVGTTFQSRPWRPASASKRSFIEENVESGEFDGYGVSDVKAHYPSTQDEAIERVLCVAGNPSASIDQVMFFLRLLRDTPGVPAGLPIGPEASALLGTLVLRPLDLLLRRRGLPFVRYVDDIFIFCGSEGEFSRVSEALSHQLSYFGQDLNWAKNEYHPCAGAVDQADAGSLDEMASDFEESEGESDLWAALEAGDASRVSFLLGGLRWHSDPSGIAPLRAYAWAVRELPRQTMSYLRSVREFVGDWDWLHEELLGGADPSRAAASLHIAYSLRRDETPATLGAAMFDLALQLDARELGPLRAMLFATSARSQERAKLKTHRALDFLDADGDLGDRRALVGSLKACGSTSGATRMALRHALRLTPDLAPTTEWTLAA
jgi:Reverse transcriptase (RNA-dependent DNA polymerase)